MATSNQGGRAAHASGNAHEFTSEEARAAGSQSHKNDGNQQSGAAGSRGSKDDSDSDSDSAAGSKSGGSGGTRAGTSEQNAEAGRQSQKKDS
ncbi:hypothetical protein GJ698_17990 [Pseudoduganella sp. FT26W]|uniref:Stress-induced protein n=1 Tax=Duganella aquatilis TaxID=2666082 RepID=A0A844D1I2_9BURK|nr:hypothetical protein [Duganella aquatilis]MRW85968.1 hypothetical protein [Duganella aquatilis]